MSSPVWGIFQSLLNSSAFSSSSDASIMAKYTIFYDFWMKEVNWLRSQFDEEGMARDGSGRYGFGFLVEEFARRSKNLPLSNTERGQRMATAILEALHSGDSDMIQLGRSRANSDLLWVGQTGQRTTIVGIGEIKASYEAYRRKTDQLSRQETALDLLAGQFSKGRAVHPFFRKKRIEVSDQLIKVLVVPSGEKARIKSVPGGWQIVEIEFSHSELVFISKLVWSNVWPNTSFSVGQISQLWSFMSDRFVPRVAPVFNDLLGAEQGSLPYWELGLFVWATSKLPVLEEDRQLVAELVSGLYWESVEDALRLTSPLEYGDLTQYEKDLYGKYSVAGMGDKQADALMFIGLTRTFAGRMKEEVKKAGKARTIRRMPDLNLTEI